MKKYLQITADDFGYSSERNEGVVSCFQAGAVTRSSLMVNATAAKEAANLAKKHAIHIGLHLNLTEGSPVSDVSEVQSLVSPAGFMLGKMGFRNALHQSRLSMSEVAVEMKAQIDLFKRLTGHPPPYVDGHQHVHVLPGMAEVFAKVLHENNITYTRLPYEPGIDSYDYIDKSWLRKFLAEVSQQAEEAAAVYDQHGVKYNKGFIGMGTMGSDMTVQRLQDQISATFAMLTKTAKDTQPLGKVSSKHKRPHSNNDESAPMKKHKSGEVKDSPSKGDDSGQSDVLQTITGNRNDKTVSSGEGDVVTDKIHLDSQQDLGASSDNVDGVVCELMCHPGYPCVDPNGGCGEGPDDFAMSDERKYEVDILCSSAMLDFYKKLDIVLIN